MLCVWSVCVYMFFFFGVFFFFFQAEDGIRDIGVTGVQTCALPICPSVEGRCLLYQGQADQLFQGQHQLKGFLDPDPEFLGFVSKEQSLKEDLVAGLHIQMETG